LRKLKEQRIGLRFTNNKDCQFTVIDYINANDVTIKFDDCKPTKVKWDHVISGLIRYPNEPFNCGVGFIGDGLFSSVKDKEPYRRWDKLLSRVYREVTGATVCSEWLNFQKFCNWYYLEPYRSNTGVNNKIYHLDKDILGNGIYEPNSCCFIPQQLNQILTNTKDCRGFYPVGNKFSVRTIRCGYVGTFETEEEALYQYKRSKIKDINFVLEQESYQLREDVIEKILLKFK
jgi:hypothetical protein